MLDVHLAKRRIQQLSDAIFALTLIIMISNIEVPTLSSGADLSDFKELFFSNLNGMGMFLITFVIIAIYWIKHVELFSVIVAIDKTLLWYQLLFLAFLLLVPITNAFTTIDSSNKIVFNEIVLIVYSINLLAIGLVSWLSWRHLVKNPECRADTFSEKDCRQQTADALVEPLVAIISIPASFLSLFWWQMSFLLLPIAFGFRKKYKEKGTK